MFSKMVVDLVTRVYYALSNSVAKTLQFSGGEELSEATGKFAAMFNKAFAIL